MTARSLSLEANERVLINGAIVENGNRPSEVQILTEGVNILRLKDALHPREVKSPVRRVRYVLQLILSGDADPEEARIQVYRGLEQLGQVFSDDDSKSILKAALKDVSQDKFYEALRRLVPLSAREDRLLSYR